MTSHVHAPVLKPHAEIARQAREIHPVQFTGRLIVSVIAFTFTAIGWTVGATWFALAFTLFWVISRIDWIMRCFAAGVRLGARVPVEDGKNG